MPTTKRRSADDAERPSCHAKAKHHARMTSGTYAPSGNERTSLFMKVQGQRGGRLPRRCRGRRRPVALDPIDDRTRRAANQWHREEVMNKLERPADQDQPNELRT